MDVKAAPDAVEILLFSNDRHTRETIMDAAGVSGVFDLPPIKWLEVATSAAVKQNFEEGRFAALVLDAEVPKEGGESVSRWLHDHSEKVPPVVMLVARQQDEWMARWSGAKRCVPAPYDAEDVVNTIREVLKPAN